jgi:23S rRNA (uridine2552-2'-O)-methyltransferase
MPREWIRRQKKDKFYQKAKEEGFRARAAYKIRQIQTKFKVISQGNSILDIGCAPGSWIQEIKREFKEVSITGVDLVKMRPIEGVIFVKGDIGEDTIIDNLAKVLPQEMDVILSDCAPKLSGSKETDYARHIFLVERVLQIMKRFLKQNGHLVCKLFDGEDTNKIRTELKQTFKEIWLFKPESSRKESAELYLIGKYYKRSD